MLKLVKHLKGHSGAKVSLYVEDNEYFVIKENYKKARESVEILNALPFPTPHVYEVTDDKIVMDYINGQDMKSYLLTATEKEIQNLIDFISGYVNWCLDNSTNVDFYEQVYSKIMTLGNDINISYLLKEKWSDIPQSLIHGDFTLENIMYANGKFYLIDANPTELNSVYFDINKLRQDLDCLWFVRNEKEKIHYKIVCEKISKELKKRFNFMQKDTIMVLMLSRILPYTKDSDTKDFLYKEIEKIWQL
jgi:tRNA A-37 threonylcarbamoyl transferase component Bud32